MRRRCASARCPPALRPSPRRLHGIRAIVYAAGAGVGRSATPLNEPKNAPATGDSMKFRMWGLAVLATLAAAAPQASAAPSVYPTGVTIYDPGAHLERLHGALAARDAGRHRHRHERQRREALGRLQQLRGRPGARAAGRRRHRRERRAAAVSRIAGARAARLRRQGRLELRSQRADRAARPRHRLVVAAASRLAARGFSGRLLLAGEHAGHDGQQHADPDAHEPQPAGGRRRRARGRPAHRGDAGRAHRVGVDGRRAHRRARLRAPTRAPRSERPPTSTPRAARSTGCTSTRRPMSARIAGSMRATSVSRRTTSSSAAVRRACSPSSRATAASSGSSGPTSARRKSCARFARSSVSITRI